MKKFILLFSISISCFAQQLVEPPTIIQNPMNLEQQFGSRIAIEGNYSVIGSNYETIEVYVYEKSNTNTWFQKQILTISGITVGDGFGNSVAISGNTIIIGAENKPNSSNGTGAVYIFEKNVNNIWEEKQVLFRNNPTPFSNTNFGNHVAINGNFIIVGGSYGIVSIYTKNPTGSWEFLQDIIPSDGIIDTGFGKGSNPIAINNNYIAIGNFKKNNEGVVYTYSKNGNTWQSDTVISIPNTSFRGFGYAVALNESELLISAPFDGGKIAFFGRNNTNTNWEEKGIFTSNTPSDTYFGDNVALSDSYALVGGFDSTGGFFVAHLMAKNDLGNWEYIERKSPSDNFATVEAESGLAVSENSAFIGAGTWNEVYIYEIDPGSPTCTDISIPDAVFEQWLVDQQMDSDNLVNGIISSCDAEKVTTITINPLQGITNLTGIEGFINLETLYIPENDLVILDLSQNTKLISVNVFFNFLEQISVNNARLVSLNVSDNFFTSLDISGINNLQSLEARFNTNLTCIQVRDLAEASAKSSGRRPVWRVDDTSIFSLACPSPVLRSPLSKSEKTEIRNMNVIENNILIFPTQITNNKLTILTNGEANYNVQIFDIYGNAIQEYKQVLSQRKDLDISNLSSGLYIAKVSYGKDEYTAKFVKQ
ncbi:T9SS type A sorting domain-containing protein [Aquimarina celericrescens]|uniref:T9SS type A sorting domain-containing protein n=1 Tax=Aquimarina celericrescens TaxID=1964542 RepID=A0ABW5AWK0_9FLAO|nr:T9SS type A sorting domain-containing protein [Aquimarina celericrescens]